jgi:hypothetical protein
VAQDTERQGEHREWRVERWLKRAAAGAAAIGTIATTVALLWPDDPAKQAATFEQVSVDVGVGLTEFQARGEGLVAASATGTVRLRLVAQQDERTPPPEEAEPPAESVPPSEGEEGEGEPSDPSQETAPEEEQHEMPGTIPPGVAEELERLPTPIEIVDGDTVVAESPDVQQAIYPLMDDEAFSAPEGEEPDEPAEDEGVSAEAVARIFRETRSRPAGDGVEPVGVTVDFDVAAVGFKGRRLDVRWTLHSASTRKRVPRPWLRNRPAMRIEPEADDERSSGSFWVPLPRARGRWFVRLKVYDRRGRRLSYADTRRFG